MRHYNEVATMVIFLYGPDSYRRTRKVREVVSKYKKKHATADLLGVDLDENPDGWRDARDFVNQPSMFTEAKLLLVREGCSISEKEWVKTLKRCVGLEHVFVIVSDMKEPKKDFKFLLEIPVAAQEFSALDGRVLAVFIEREAKAKMIALQPEALALFSTFIAERAPEERGWVADNELQKLAFTKFEQPITKHSLEEFLTLKAQEDVSRLTMRLAYGRDFSQKLAALEQLLTQKSAPAHVFNLLGYYTKGATAVALADYDISVKSGGLEYEEALLDFALM
jgi:DNA polymerase III delta subunit